MSTRVDLTVPTISDAQLDSVDEGDLDELERDLDEVEEYDDNIMWDAYK